MSSVAFQLNIGTRFVLVVPFIGDVRLIAAGEVESIVILIVILDEVFTPSEMLTLRM